MIWGLPSRRRRVLARVMRAARKICRRDQPDGEWGHYESRWWGYRLKYLGPCREFHINEPWPGAAPLIDCESEDEDAYDDDDEVED